MRPLLFKLPFETDTSFYYSKYDCSYFERPWHFHKEFELVYIVKSTGTKFVGNQVQAFEDGDLTLIGADIPHLFRNDEWYYQDENQNMSSSIFIHFDPTFFGDKFLEIPEFKKVKKLLEDASLGLQILGETNVKIAEILTEMQDQDASTRIISLIQILNILSKSITVKPILRIPFVAKSNHHAAKINKVFNYIMLNYTREIYLKEIADELHMSTAAFSRYFKTHTSKTFSDYVTEIRINHACKLLVENNYSVSEIGFMCGFENKANFYRHFKNQVGKVPKEYLRSYRL